MGILAKVYIDSEHVAAAIALYNGVRTTLEDNGWAIATSDNKPPTYWWTHPDHGGVFSIGAAHYQNTLDVERTRKAM